MTGWLQLKCKLLDSETVLRVSCLPQNMILNVRFYLPKIYTDEEFYIVNHMINKLSGQVYETGRTKRFCEFLMRWFRTFHTLLQAMAIRMSR